MAKPWDHPDRSPPDYQPWLGGYDLRTLFIATWDGLFRIQLKIPGLPVSKAL